MQQKTLKTLLVCLLTFAGMGKSYAYDIEVANADGVTIYYNFTHNKTELEVTFQETFEYNADYAGKVVIPESVTYEGNAYPVTSIGLYAFYGCDGLTSVTIPNGVTTIGYMAFSRCGGLTEVTIPNSVASIGYAAFSWCGSLTEVTIPNSVTEINSSTFSFCTSLTSVTIPNSVTSIGDQAFWNCNRLTSVTIPNSVTSIGDFAFWNCRSLTEVTIGNSVISISDGAFASCSGIEKIVVESGNPNYDSRDNCNAIIETEKNELLLGCKNTKIPNSVTSIGTNAFASCSGLTELNLPSSVTSISDGAFYGCSGLTELTIPNSVTSIGEEAFYRCSGLTKIYSLNTTPPTADTSTFDNDQYENVNLYVPQEALEAYQTADVWKDFQKLQGFDAAAVERVITVTEQIQSANGQITVTGLTDGTTVNIYDLSGQQTGSAVSTNGQATVTANLTIGSAAIVKIGGRSIKITMK